jgi:hypothetical protein
MLPDFVIKPKGEISNLAITNGVSTFKSAMHWIKNLPYRRNSNKLALNTIVSDGGGTCSSKHAFLKQLATENELQGLQLMTGIFKMNALNTPKIEKTLIKYQLNYIPEAHCYLKYDGIIIDCTNSKSSADDFKNELIQEMEIEVGQIADFKVALHKNFIQNWLSGNKEIPFTLEDIWRIREQCIVDLSS